VKHAMRTLREVLQEAEPQKVAVGYFNVSDLTGKIHRGSRVPSLHSQYR